MRHFFIGTFTGICLFCTACAPEISASETIPVFVSIPPQKYFVEKIGGELVSVSVMVGPGANAHTFEPKPAQMTGLAKARAYFAIGMEFETVWLDKIAAANPKLLIVHTEKGLERIPMKEHHSDGEHKDSHSDQHEHQGISDPHIWLSPPLVKLQAKNILDGLIAADSAHQAAYLSNYETFIKETESLDAEIKGLFAEKGKGSRFMVFHPSWGYFAQAYGLEQIAVEIEGKEPKPAQLAQLIEHARKEGIRVIFVQPQFSVKNAETVAKAIRGQVVFADPLAEDWAKNLRDVAAKFKAALK